MQFGPDTCPPLSRHAPDEMERGPVDRTLEVEYGIGLLLGPSLGEKGGERTRFVPLPLQALLPGGASSPFLSLPECLGGRRSLQHLLQKDQGHHSGTSVK